MVIKPLKKAAKNLLRTLAIGTSLVGCYSGEPIVRSYPPLTPEIRQSLEDRALDVIESGACIGGEDRAARDDKDCARIAFNGVPQEFANYFIDFTMDEYKAAGVSMRGKHGADISIRSLREVMDICGAPACEYNGLLLMRDDQSFTYFFDTFFHEYGHYLGMGNNEFPSTANEIYSAIKAYQFSRRIGSLLLSEPIDYFFPPEDDSAFIRQYVKGYAFVPVNLIDSGGSIEHAMDFVANSPVLDVETALHLSLKEFGGVASPAASLALWERALDAPGFKSNLMSGSGRLSETEADELINYLKIKNHQAYNLRVHGHQVEQFNILRRHLDAFLADKRFSNPYFRAEVVWFATLVKSCDLAARYNWTWNYDAEAYGLAKEIIDINAPYPCRFNNPYECPAFVRNSRSAHIDAYRIIAIASYTGSMEQKGGAVDSALDFIARFYPGTDLQNYNFSAISSAADKLPDNTLPIVVFYAGHAAKELGDTYLADRLYAAGLAVQCNDLSYIVKKHYCELMQDDLRTARYHLGAWQ